MERIEILKKLEELDAENKKDYELFRKLTEKEDNKTIHPLPAKSNHILTYKIGQLA